jgi:hypothetical protein
VNYEVALFFLRFLVVSFLLRRKPIGKFLLKRRESGRREEGETIEGKPLQNVGKIFLIIWMKLKKNQPVQNKTEKIITKTSKYFYKNMRRRNSCETLGIE